MLGTLNVSSICRASIFNDEQLSDHKIPTIMSGGWLFSDSLWRTWGGSKFRKDLSRLRFLPLTLESRKTGTIL